MSAVLERLKSRGGDLGATLTVEVPEWTPDGEPPLVVHYRKASIAELAEVQQLDTGDPMRQQVRLVLRKATDAGGNRLIAEASLSEVMALPAAELAVFVRLANLILGGMSPAEARKN